MSKLNKRNILKIITIIISIGILAIVLWIFIPLIKDITTLEGRINFKKEISEMGIKGALILYLLEAVQMIFVILPGEPIEILYGMCYGTIWGAILLTITVFINTLIIYFIVKKYGRKVLIFFFSEEKIAKVENSKLLKKQDKIEYIFIILFFLPGTPKDLLLYIGALLPIKPVRFILISTFVRFPSVITSTMAGSGIANGNIKVTIIIYALMAITIAVIFIIQKITKKESILI